MNKNIDIIEAVKAGDQRKVKEILSTVPNSGTTREEKGHQEEVELLNK